MFSYRPSTQKEGEIRGITGLGGSYSSQNFWNHLYEAVTIGLNSKYFLSEKRTFFLEANIFFRHWWFDNKYGKFDNVEGYRFDGLRTERQNVYGLKLYIGHSFSIKSEQKVKPIFDLYSGIGVRYKEYEFETYNGTVLDVYHNYKKDIGNYWTPTLHLGVKIGLSISK